MPKKKRSALKRIRQTGRRTTIKTLASSASRTAVRVAREAISAGKEIEEAIANAASALDKAAKRGAIHKNAARRKRSRLAKAANKTKKAG